MCSRFGEKEKRTKGFTLWDVDVSKIIHPNTFEIICDAFHVIEYLCRQISRGINDKMF